MRLLTFDASKSKTGWAFWDLPIRNGALPDTRGVSGIVTGSFASKGESLFDAIQSFHPQFVGVIKDHRPDFVVFEEGLANIKSYETEGQDMGGSFAKKAVNAKSALVLQRILGNMQAVVMGLRIPHESVGIETWRKAFLGFGRKKGWSRVDYKRAAKAQCDMLGIPARNQDEAEAAGICYWAAIHSQHLKMVVSEVAA